MSTRGFMLIEVLTYVGLLSLLLGGFLSSAYALFHTSDRNQTSAMLVEEARFLTAKIDGLLDEARIVSVPVGNASGVDLAVETYEGSAKQIILSDGNIFLNGHVLNNANTSVSNLIFIHTSHPQYVEAGFTLSARASSGRELSRHASTTRYIGI